MEPIKMTMAQMQEQYPESWLLLTHCVLSPVTGRISSGMVFEVDRNVKQFSV